MSNLWGIILLFEYPPAMNFRDISRPSLSRVFFAFAWKRSSSAALCSRRIRTFRWSKGRSVESEPPDTLLLRTPSSSSLPSLLPFESRGEIDSPASHSLAGCRNSSIFDRRNFSTLRRSHYRPVECLTLNLRGWVLRLPWAKCSIGNYQLLIASYRPSPSTIAARLPITVDDVISLMFVGRSKRCCQVTDINVYELGSITFEYMHCIPAIICWWHLATMFIAQPIVLVCRPYYINLLAVNCWLLNCLYLYMHLLIYL